MLSKDLTIVRITKTFDINKSHERSEYSQIGLSDFFQKKVLKFAQLIFYFSRFDFRFLFF